MVQDIKGHSVVVEGRVTYYRKCRVVSFEYPSVILQFFLKLITEIETWSF